jgi:hypothetical protein
VRFDNNKYSVLSSAVGRPVEIHAYAIASSSAKTARLLENTPAASAATR